METRQLTTSDGHVLTADLALPADGELRGGVVVCHPHPQYGGNRFNPVVGAIFDRLPAAGFAALRFDFRADHGGGETEPLDVVAALDALAEVVDGPLAVAGYSFGAAMALRTDDPRIRALALVAPPLARMSSPEPIVPTLVLAPRHDQITSLEEASAIVDGWRHGTIEIVESADHFLAGHTDAVGERVVACLAAVLTAG
jgi:alpha/beta superfamily hydrolase